MPETRTGPVSLAARPDGRCSSPNGLFPPVALPSVHGGTLVFGNVSGLSADRDGLRRNLRWRKDLAALHFGPPRGPRCWVRAVGLGSVRRRALPPEMATPFAAGVRIDEAESGSVHTRIDPLKAKDAIIQLRLRVWILPVDSNVESSNMACLPESIQPRRSGDGESCRGATVLLLHGTRAEQASRPAAHPIRNHCACVDTAPHKVFPQSARKCIRCVKLRVVRMRRSLDETFSLFYFDGLRLAAFAGRGDLRHPRGAAPRPAPPNPARHPQLHSCGLGHAHSFYHRLQFARRRER